MTKKQQPVKDAKGIREELTSGPYLRAEGEVERNLYFQTWYATTSVCYSPVSSEAEA